MCYVIAEAGRQSLRAAGRLQADAHGALEIGASRAAGVSSACRRDRGLRQARHDLHVTGWALRSPRR